MKAVAVAVAGAGALGPWGLGWRGCARFQERAAPSRQLAESHPGTLGFEVPPLPPVLDAGDARQRKYMSQAARLSAIAQREALRDAGWREGREGIGCFLGVGASGARMEEIPPALDPSIVDGAFSQRAFGAKGLYACNPLFVFQLMNNFSLCHGAILEGLGGPSGAFHSRGRGTLGALEEALATLAEGDCARVLAGGADSCHHPVTWSEARRQGLADQGLLPGEGAALLALEARDPEGPEPLAWIRALGEGLDLGDLGDLEDLRGGKHRKDNEAMGGPEAPGRVLLSAWNDEIMETLARQVRDRWPGAPVLAWHPGECLAAGPALAWAAGLDLLHAREAGEAPPSSVLVLTQGTDGLPCHLLLGRHP